MILLTQKKYGKTKLQELKAEPMQLLLYQSSSSAIILSGAIFIFDDYAKIPEYNFTVDGTVRKFSQVFNNTTFRQ